MGYSIDTFTHTCYSVGVTFIETSTKGNVMKTVEQIVSAHNWVKTVQRNFTPRGHKPLGKSSTLVDSVYIPFLDETFVLAFESSWATTGGTRQDAVLYAYNRAGYRREVATHTIFNGRDPMSSFYPQRIAATIRFVTEDYPTRDIKYRYSFGQIQLLRAGSFTRESRVKVRVFMSAENSACEIEGLYETSHLEFVNLGITGHHKRILDSSQRWTTGEVSSSVLTKRNISRFYKKYTAELPTIPIKDGVG